MKKEKGAKRKQEKWTRRKMRWKENHKSWSPSAIGRPPKPLQARHEATSVGRRRSRRRFLAFEKLSTCRAGETALEGKQLSAQERGFPCPHVGWFEFKININHHYCMESIRKQFRSHRLSVSVGDNKNDSSNVASNSTNQFTLNRKCRITLRQAHYAFGSIGSWKMKTWRRMSGVSRVRGGCLDRFRDGGPTWDQQVGVGNALEFKRGNIF